MKNKIVKKVFVTLIILIFCQLGAIIFSSVSTSILNSHLIFGLFGSNIPAIILPIFFLVIFSLVFRKEKYLIPVFIVVGATLSNIFDRIIFGGVRDYFQLFSIPTFNFADILIIVGVLVVFIISLKSIKTKR